MCGIVYRKSLDNNDVTTDIVNMYKNQKHRGQDGFGFYLPNKNKTIHRTDEKSIIDKLRSVSATEVLFHHRYPTSTDNVLNACHPFRVTIDNTDYVVVHNGYLYNEHELRTQHEQLGYKYTSVQPDGRFNDSESLAYDLALYLSGKQDKLYAEGAIAFIVYTKDAVYFGRNSSSPLKYHQNDRFITIRSEGKGIDVKTNTLYRLSNNELTEKYLEVPEYNYTPTWQIKPKTSTEVFLEDDEVNQSLDSIQLISKEIVDTKRRLRNAIKRNDMDMAYSEAWYLDALQDDLEYITQLTSERLINERR
jgi:asparagine synthetase B (glutamine-hydrolysing)